MVRNECSRRPRFFGPGNNGSTRAYSSSVKSVAYFVVVALYRRRSASVHGISDSRVIRKYQGIRSGEAGQLTFGQALSLTQLSFAGIAAAAIVALAPTHRARRYHNRRSPLLSHFRTSRTTMWTVASRQN